VHSDVIQSFISPNNAQLICFKILKNFKFLKQISFALVQLIKDWMKRLDEGLRTLGETFTLKAYLFSLARGQCLS
jgi:hypothetical protein